MFKALKANVFTQNNLSFSRYATASSSEEARAKTTVL